MTSHNIKDTALICFKLSDMHKKSQVCIINNDIENCDYDTPQGISLDARDNMTRNYPMSWYRARIKSQSIKILKLKKLKKISDIKILDIIT